MIRLSCAVATISALATPAADAQEILELSADDLPLAADFEEAMRIGAGDAEWETLVDVVGIAFDEAGNIFIADFTFEGLRVIVVAPSGELVASFGRRGGGPGEWRGPVMQMVVLQGGQVVVPDAVHRAYHLFARDGSLERMMASPAFPATARWADWRGAARSGP